MSSIRFKTVNMVSIVVGRYVLAVAVIAWASAIFAYIAVVWRKAPKASRTMKWIAAISITTGILIGFVADRLLRPQIDNGSLGSFDISANLCSPDGFPATVIGKAIVLTNQQHAGDPNWIDPMEIASSCSSSTYSTDDRICEVYFLASHALGLNLTEGDTRKCIPNENVAELCTAGDIAKSSPLCNQAFDFQRQKLSP
jgi:hypothetical protein